MQLPEPNRIFFQPDPPNIPGRCSRGAQFGSTVTEYALIGVGIAVLSIGALTMLGTTLSGIFHDMLGVNNYQPQVFASAHTPQTSLATQVSSTLNGSAANNTAASVHAVAPGSLTQTAGGNGTTLTIPHSNPDSADSGPSGANQSQETDSCNIGGCAVNPAYIK